MQEGVEILAMSDGDIKPNPLGRDGDLKPIPIAETTAKHPRGTNVVPLDFLLLRSTYGSPKF